MTLRIPLGISSFRRIREDRLTYVDKTHLIRDLIDDPSLVILLPRPRRFGKTVNLSMLRCFFEKSAEPLWPLFAGLAIDQAGPTYRVHFQRFPTIALTFKDIKGATWDACRRGLALLIAELYREHDYLLDGPLSPMEADDYHAVLRREAGDEVLCAALRRLSAYLARHHKEKVLLLLDEYDTPLHAAYLQGYYESAVGFFRDLLSGALKDNDHLHKGVLTGVLRVARDSIFTGLNNLDVYTLLAAPYSTAFGFTEPEVNDLVDKAGLLDLMAEIRRWYNGYVFGGHEIYNPWSVLAYLKRGERQPAPYWAETSGNDLVRDLLLTQGLGLDADMERLLAGETIEVPIAEHLALRDLRDDPGQVWGLLLFTGYLKAVRQHRDEAALHCELALPNVEVRSLFETLFRKWVAVGLGGDRRRQALVTALLGGDAETAGRLLQQWLVSNASFWDTAAYDPPERFYHGFVLGLLVSLGPAYEVISNRESGHGRCDVLILPRRPGQPGVALELKARGEQSAEQALDAALAQIRQRDYAQSLRDRGAAPIHELAFVFEQKRVHARKAPLSK